VALHGDTVSMAMMRAVRARVDFTSLLLLQRGGGERGSGDAADEGMHTIPRTAWPGAGSGQRFVILKTHCGALAANRAARTTEE
jgi:hypothetical protein